MINVKLRLSKGYLHLARHLLHTCTRAILKQTPDFISTTTFGAWSMP